jgi:hypothetical protein
MKPITVYNTSKSRLETITVEFSEKKTTWFDDESFDNDIQMITDAHNGLLISQRNYGYPFLIAGISRADIAYSARNALELIRSYTNNE